MNSLRRWLYRPKRADPSLLAQFYFADEELNTIAAELDSFEARKDPERCTTLVNQLRACQARVLSIVFQMMEESVKDLRAPRDFRVKFPDDIIQENLAGQLWFGAECLAAGSSIMNREVESAAMRPLARALTKNLDRLRGILREQCLRSVNDYTRLIKESLIIFDKLFAEFELSYVSAMVPVKTAHEYDMIQEITVLFSETVQRALSVGLLTQDTIDEYDPALMFTIPRLAIVSGVLVFKDGPLNPDSEPWQISEMFRPFQALLIKIRDLLSILSADELHTLEAALCSQAEPSFLASLEKEKASDRKKLINSERKQSEGDSASIGSSEMSTLEIAERLEALAQNFQASRSAKTVESVDSMRVETTIASLSCRLSSDGSETSSTFSSSLSDNESDDDSKVDIVSVNGCDNIDIENGQVCDEVDTKSSNVCTCSSRSEIVSASAVTTIECSGSNSNEATPDLSNCALQSTVNSLDKAQSQCNKYCNSENDKTKTIEKSCENQNSEIPSANSEDQACSIIKSDSLDSGLQSDLLSPSDSRNTLSSTDSNLHPTPTPSSPTDQATSNIPSPTPETSHSNHPDSSRHPNLVSNDHSTLIENNCIECQNESYDNSCSKFDKQSAASSTNPIADCEGSDLETKGNLKCNCDRDSGNSDTSMSPVNKSDSTVDPSQTTESVNQNSDIQDMPSSSSSSSNSASKNVKTDINGNRKCDKDISKLPKNSGRDTSRQVAIPLNNNVQRIKTRRSNKKDLVKSSLRNKKTSSDDCHSSETSSYTSDCGDKEEIALAVEAAEKASRSKVRSQFRSSNDMIHRLFVCISGVADQLQTNYAGDLRNILRAVFDMNCSYRSDMGEENKDDETTALGAAYRAIRINRRNRNGGLPQDPPEWLPDEDTNECMSCQAPFTFVRRRHHCRNCGKIYCGRCSNNFVPLPHFGEERHVRVCNRCFMFQVTHFTQRSPT